MKTPGLWKGTAAQGHMPAMGAKLEIDEIERTETGENSQTPGCLAYQAFFHVVEPEEYKGRRLREWFNIGTREDKRAKRDDTWNRPEGGPGRLLRMMEKAGVANSDDDDEWMDAAQGCSVYAHVMVEADRRDGQQRNKIGMFFDAKDEDFVGVGEALQAPNERKKARGGKPADTKSARGTARRREDDDEDDDKKDEENGEEETKAKPARGGKSRDEDEDEQPKRAARGGNRRDRDEDED